MKKKKQSKYVCFIEGEKYYKVDTNKINEFLKSVYNGEYQWFNHLVTDLILTENEFFCEYKSSNSNHIRSAFLLNGKDHKKAVKESGSVRLFVIEILNCSLRSENITDKIQKTLKEILSFYSNENNFIEICADDYFKFRNKNYTDNISKAICIFTSEILDVGKFKNIYYKFYNYFSLNRDITIFVFLLSIIFFNFGVIMWFIFSFLIDLLKNREFYFDFLYKKKAFNNISVFWRFTFPMLISLFYTIVFFPIFYTKGFLSTFNFSSFFINFLCYIPLSVPFFTFINNTKNLKREKKCSN